MNEYFYRLGHISDLAVYEFERLSSIPVLKYNNQWLFSEYDLNVNRTGSLVYSGQIIEKIQRNSFTQELVVSAISKALKKLKLFIPNEKKLGIAVDGDLNSKDLIRLGKNAGFKKINILEGGKMPNFGHWKSTNAWVIGFWVNQEFIIGFLKDYADQEFWKDLDEKLPESDMRRGIINLKLAKSLINLASSKAIWDPFCGQGRVVIAGMDFPKEYFVSDIDPVCLPQLKENWEFATKLWGESRYSFNAILKKVFVGDSKQLSILSIREGLQTKNISIVTEGYLGFNFNQIPHKKDVERELESQESLWEEVLGQAFQIGIPELVFCLPFYSINGYEVYPQFINNLSAKKGFNLIKEIKYRRKNTITGHYICHLIKI